MTASPAPRRKRTVTKMNSAPAIFAGTRAVRAVKTPHHATPAASTRRASEAVRQPSADGLEKCITDQHGAEHFSQLHIAEMVGLGDGSAGNGNVYPVEIRNSTEDEQPEHQKPSHMARSGTVHRWHSRMLAGADGHVIFSRSMKLAFIPEILPGVL